MMKIRRGAGPPPALSAGQLGHDQTANFLYIGDVGDTPVQLTNLTADGAHKISNVGAPDNFWLIQQASGVALFTVNLTPDYAIEDTGRAAWIFYMGDNGAGFSYFGVMNTFLDHSDWGAGQYNVFDVTEDGTYRLRGITNRGTEIPITIDGSPRMLFDSTGIGEFGVPPVGQQTIVGATTQDQVDSIVAAGVARGSLIDGR